MARGDRRSMYLQQYKAAFFSCSRFTKMAGNGELALWRGRAVQSAPGKRCTLFEPFGKPQDKLREFARRWACPEQSRRSRRTAKGTRRACPRGGGGPRHGLHGFGDVYRNNSGLAAWPRPGSTTRQDHNMVRGVG